MIWKKELTGVDILFMCSSRIVLTAVWSSKGNSTLGLMYFLALNIGDW